MAEEEEQLELVQTLKKFGASIASPFAAIRNEGLESLLAFLHSLQPSSPLQETLSGNFLKDLFYRTFPRRELSLAFVNGVQIPKLSHDEALRWTPLPAVAPDAQSALRDVTLYQQELVMRCVQGLCTLFPSQRDIVQDTALFPVVVETFGCCYLHLEARHRDVLEHNALTAYNNSSSYNATAPHSFAVAPGGQVVVAIDPSLEALLVAMLDAVEAACFYNPKSYVQLVALHGVKHLMRVACAPFAPHSLRGAILDMISLLMQQVQPFTTAHLQQALQRQKAEAEQRARDREAAMLGDLEALARMNAAGQITSSSGPGGVRHHSPPARRGDDPRGWRHDPVLYSNSPSPANNNNAGADAVEDKLPLLDRASASKFDNAVRDWLREHGLTTVAQQLLKLKDVGGVAVPSQIARQEAVRVSQRLNRAREKIFQELLAAIDSKKGMST